MSLVGLYAYYDGYFGYHIDQEIIEYDHECNLFSYETTLKYQGNTITIYDYSTIKPNDSVLRSHYHLADSIGQLISK